MFVAMFSGCKPHARQRPGSVCSYLSARSKNGPLQVAGTHRRKRKRVICDLRDRSGLPQPTKELTFNCPIPSLRSFQHSQWSRTVSISTRRRLQKTDLQLSTAHQRLQASPQTLPAQTMPTAVLLDLVTPTTEYHLRTSSTP